MKEYIAPEIDIIQFDAEDMIVASCIYDSGFDCPEFNYQICDLIMLD